MKLIVPESLGGERLDRVLAFACEMSRAHVAKLIENGGVFVNGKLAKARSQIVSSGAEIEVEDSVPDARQLEGADVAFDVVYEDESLLVINKPVGLIVHPGAGTTKPTLVHGLIARNPEIRAAFPDDFIRPGIVHRLDIGTSGLLVVAKSPHAHSRLVDMMKAREVHREYCALVWGDVQPDVGVVDAPIGRAIRRRTRRAVVHGGRDARTHYEVLARGESPSVSWLSLTLETGRTHQIRVHMSAIRHPVVGDATYNGSRESIAVNRPMLHAWKLRFVHPLSDEPMAFVAPLPKDIVDVLQELAIAPEASPLD